MSSVADALMWELDLDLVDVWLTNPIGWAPFEVVRVSESGKFDVELQEIWAWITDCFAEMKRFLGAWGPVRRGCVAERRGLRRA
jgi:hypothetical protein